jgi:hypothetical protein
MPTQQTAIAAVVSLLAVSILACAGPSLEPTPTPLPPTATTVPTATLVPPTSTPEVREPNYSSASLAMSLWYPETWVLEDMPDAVAFASSSALISSEDWETGAAFAVMRGELEEGQTIKELIREQLEASAFDEIESTDLEPLSIGGVRGVITNLEATPPGTTKIIKGFVAGAEHNQRAYLFMAISVKDDWPEFGEILDAMLHSVRFTEPAGTFTSEDLGLKIWHPKDWIVEEDTGQVLFATSRDLIDSGDLQSGAAFMVRRSTLRGAGLVQWFEEELHALTFEEGGLHSDMAYRTIAGQEGLIIDLWGVPSGAATTITGFAAAVAYDDWGYLILGIAADREWPQYHPTLAEMLDTVQFIE